MFDFKDISICSALLEVGNRVYIWFILSSFFFRVFYFAHGTIEYEYFLKIVLLDTFIDPLQLLPLQVRMNLEVISVKGYTTHPHISRTGPPLSNAVYCHTNTPILGVCFIPCNFKHMVYTLKIRFLSLAGRTLFKTDIRIICLLGRIGGYFDF